MGKYWDLANGVQRQTEAPAHVKQPIADETSPVAGAGAAPTQGAVLPPGAGRYWAAANGIDLSAVKETPAVATSDEAPEQGWGGWLREKVRGKQDPAYAGTGTIYEQFTDDLRSPTATAAMAGASDPQMADIIRKQLGDRFIRSEKDANGYDVFVTRGAGGQEQRGYVNAPGLDTQDMWRTFYGAAPYVATGGAVGGLTARLGTKIAGQITAQGLGAAATSLAGDAVQIPMGSEQGLDLYKALITGGAGAVGTGFGASIAPAWRKFLSVPAYFNKATGRLTEKGIAAAKRAKLDPADFDRSMSEAFAKNMGETGDAMAAASRVQTEPFGIPVTTGQVTKRPSLLTQEEAMRRGNYGEGAENVMLGFDKRQQDAIRRAALGPTDDRPYTPGGPYTSNVPGRIAPARHPGITDLDRSPQVLGDSIRSGMSEAFDAAKATERGLWKGTSDVAATPRALQTLPDKINAAMADEGALTAGGKSAFEALDHFMQGKVPETAIGAFKVRQTQSVDQMRRTLGNIVDAAPDRPSQRQAKMVYEAFNDWIGESAEKALLAGDPAAAMNIAKARGFTREMKALIAPKDKAGRLTPAAQRIAKILDDGKADSGEAVINGLFGSQGSQTAGTGTVNALANVKAFLQMHAPKELARQTWDDIRLAYWTRLVQNGAGELHGPQAMLGNIRKAMNSQRSMMDVLYSSEERKIISQFSDALQVAVYKPPNASGSGYTTGRLVNEGLAKVLDAVGLGRVYRAAGSKYGLGDFMSTGRAKDLTSGAANPPRVPNGGPLGGWTGAEFERQR